MARRSSSCLEMTTWMVMISALREITPAELGLPPVVHKGASRLENFGKPFCECVQQSGKKVHNAYNVLEGVWEPKA